MKNRSPAGSKPRGDAGFTLIELLVVIAIIALLVAIVPAQFSRSHASLERSKAAQILIGDLRELREDALANGMVTSLSITADHHGYALGPRSQARELPRAYRLELLADDGAAGGEERISFFADGSSSGGRLRLTDADRWVVVSVRWTSGRVAIDE